MAASNDPLAAGDLIAQRRYAYAQAAAADGDHEAAADMFEQALERAPDWPAALFALGEASEQLGRLEAAEKAFGRALAADPSDPFGAAARLALLIGAEAPKSLPRAYVTRLFDDYAGRFEAHLMGALAYRGPALVIEALDAIAPGRRFASALDLGCGTGLMGGRVRGRVARLEGVEIAPAMVAKAVASGLYDAVAADDAAAFLARAAQGAYALIVAADTLPYIGDLGPVFAGCRWALADGGLIVFTAETFQGDGFRLLEGLRFAHAPSYIEAAASAAGLRRLLLRRAWARLESDVQAPGLVGAFSTR